MSQASKSWVKSSIKIIKYYVIPRRLLTGYPRKNLSCPLFLRNSRIFMRLYIEYSIKYLLKSWYYFQNKKIIVIKISKLIFFMNSFFTNHPINSWIQTHFFSKIIPSFKMFRLFSLPSIMLHQKVVKVKF